MSDSYLAENSHFIQEYQTYLLTERRVSNNTLLAYQKDIGQLVDFLNKNKLTFKSCQKEDLKEFLKFLKKEKISSKTLSRKISSIKSFFNYLCTRYQIANKATTLVFPKIEKTLPNYLTQDEVMQLLFAANKDFSDKGIRNKVMLYLLYASGMRVSELVNLTVDQINFSTGFVCLMGKGNKERLVPLPKNVFELLSFYINNIYNRLMPKSSKKLELNRTEQYLFFTIYSNKIKPITRQSFWNILKKILKKAKILKNVSPHSLRHSLATHLLKSGANIRSLQMLLGHEQLSTVQIYTHLEKSHLRKIYDQKHPRA